MLSRGAREREQSSNDEPPAEQTETKSTDQTMSKNQLKKLAKKQRMLANRPEKRRLEKEKKRQKKLIMQQKRANGELLIPFPKSKVTTMTESSNKFKVVIDMDFEQYMTDDEIAKAAKQVARIYAINRKAERPCQLYICSLRGKIRERFGVTCTGYTNWDVNISECDYLDLLSLDSAAGIKDTQSCNDQKVDKQNFLYLTGDSAENLPEVEELVKDQCRIFVIGGLVDHNRHKNLCLSRAQERNVKTAKLPIDNHLKLCDRAILSTVTVFEIMIKVLGSQTPWKEALLESIPGRKIRKEKVAEDTIPPDI